MDRRIERILYQSSHRGSKELDIILGRFACTMVKDQNGKYVENIRTLSDLELEVYEKLCTLEELDIYNFVVGVENPPQEFAIMVQKIRSFLSSNFDEFNQ